jgi:hypothetical protein
MSKFRLPSGPEQGVDAIADSPGGPVRLQVVGVLPRHHLAELARTGSVTSSRTPDERADDVCAAIKKKAESYPGSVRKDVILAVDSIRSFEHVQPAVLDPSRDRRATRSLGRAGSLPNGRSVSRRSMTWRPGITGRGYWIRRPRVRRTCFGAPLAWIGAEAVVSPRAKHGSSARSPSTLDRRAGRRWTVRRST